jgi:hypothetical protein
VSQRGVRFGQRVVYLQRLHYRLLRFGQDLLWRTRSQTTERPVCVTQGGVSEGIVGIQLDRLREVPGVTRNFDDAVLVVTAPLYYEFRSTSPKFRQIDQDDICIFLQAAEDNFFSVRRDIEVVDEELTTEVGKPTLLSGDEVD